MHIHIHSSCCTYVVSGGLVWIWWFGWGVLARNSLRLPRGNDASGFFRLRPSNGSICDKKSHWRVTWLENCGLPVLTNHLHSLQSEYPVKLLDPRNGEYAVACRSPRKPQFLCMLTEWVGQVLTTWALEINKKKRRSSQFRFQRHSKTC